jgi:hypothetical protein
MTAPSAEFQIGTADLRRGLLALAPHVNTDPDRADTHRIRFELGDEVVLLATDGYTAGMYATSADHVRTFNHDYVDITPSDAQKILAVFKAGKDEDADYPDSVLQFEATEKALRIRDISGMFAGHELDLPATPSGEFPNVARLFRDRLEIAAPPSFDDDTVQVNAKLLARFSVSGKQIGGPLTIDTSTSPYLVASGEVFVGLLIPSRITDEIRGTLRDTLRRWTDTARRVAGAHAGRKADESALSDRLVAAVKHVGIRQAATVLGVAEGLSIGRAEAADLLLSMEGHGLIERKGKKRTVLFAPDEVDRVLWRLANPGQTEVDPMTEAEAAELGEPIDLPDMPTGTEMEWPPADAFKVDPDDSTLAGVALPPVSPFSDTPAPPSPFTDSDGNELPTAPTSPFDTP